jgi:hypothetical protein
MKQSTKLLIIAIMMFAMSILWFTQAGDWMYYLMGSLLLLSSFLTFKLFDLTRCDEARDYINTHVENKIYEGSGRD